MTEPHLNDEPDKITNRNILQMPLNVDFLKDLIVNENAFNKLQEIVDNINSQEDSKEIRLIREIFISMQGSEHIRNVILKEIFNNKGMQDLLENLKIANMNILIRMLKDAYKTAQTTANLYNIRLPERTVRTTAAVIEQKERTGKSLIEKVQEKYFEVADQLYSIKEEVGTLTYLEETIISAFKGETEGGSTDRGKMKQGKHTVSTLLQVVFTKLSTLNDLNNELRKNDNGEEESTIYQVDGFISIFVKEIQSHLIEAVTSPETKGIFKNINDFLVLFHQVMDENPAYKDLGIDLPRSN